MKEIVISYTNEEFDELLPKMREFKGFTRNYEFKQEDDEKWSFLGLYAEAKLKQYINKTALELSIGRGDGGIDLINNGVRYQILTRIKKGTNNNDFNKFLLYPEDYNTNADYFLFLYVNVTKQTITYKGCIQPTSDKITNNLVNVSDLECIDIITSEEVEEQEIVDTDGFIQMNYPDEFKEFTYQQFCKQRRRYNLPEISRREYENIKRINGKQLVLELVSTDKWLKEEEKRSKIEYIIQKIKEVYKIDNYDRHLLYDYATLIYDFKTTLEELGEKYGLYKKNS